MEKCVKLKFLFEVKILIKLNVDMQLNHNLKKYIEKNILPEYINNDSSHGIDHVSYVINRSFKFASNVSGVDYNIVYTVAAYHDIGHHVNPKIHEIISAGIASNDKNLKNFFSNGELEIVEEAIEDHRASLRGEPRNIYGKIVSTADRNISVESCLQRSYAYGRKYMPYLSDDELFEKVYDHLGMKFGKNGYAKFYFRDLDYENFLKEIRNLLNNKELFVIKQRQCINSNKKF